VGAAGPAVLVVGSVFVDRKRRAGEAGALTADGGVGRNVAENLARVGVGAALLTLADPGAEGGALLRRLRGAGVRVAARRVPGGTGRFEATLDADGGLAASRAHCPPVEALHWPFVRRHGPWLRGAAWIVAELGLDADMLDRLLSAAARAGVPVCGLPTRMKWVGPRRELLPRLGLLVVNAEEAGHILGDPVETPAAALRAVTALRRAGPARCAVTLGPHGVAAAGPGGPAAHYPAPRADAVDGTGAGDAFAAGMVVGLTWGYPFRRAVGLGLELARRTVEIPGNVAPSIGPEAQCAAGFAPRRILAPAPPGTSFHARAAAAPLSS